MQPLILPPAEQARRAAADLGLARAWVSFQIVKEEAAGRSQADFPNKNLPATVEATQGEMARRGMIAIQGGGNICYVRLSSRGAIVVQARPFAQRVVRLRTA